jgi:hypothetical protein
VAPLAVPVAAATGHDRAAHEGLAAWAAGAAGALAADDAEEAAIFANGKEERNMSMKLASPSRLFVAVLAVPVLTLLSHSDAIAQPATPAPVAGGTSKSSPKSHAAQKSFPTADEAAHALLAAAEADDLAALFLLFGADGKEIATSGDPVQDKNHRAQFVASAKRSMKLQREPSNPNRVLILLGEDNYPFAVPIIKTNGRWRFDTGKGKLEILARRIGSNELDAIGTCAAYVGAQFDYASEDHNANNVREYAQKLISSPGTKDGLFWPVSSDSSDSSVSPIAARVTKAIAEGYTKTSDKPVPYHGYYFRILKAQGPNATGGTRDYLVHGLMIGGFGLIVWPAEYAASGIKTFIVNQDGVIYEKDLGPGTPKIVATVAQFNPDKTWHSLR